MKKRLLIQVILTAVLVIFMGTNRTQAVTDTADDIIGGIISYAMNEAGAEDVQDWVDNTLSKETGSAEWYILGLTQYKSGEVDFSSYGKALLKFVKNVGSVSAPTKQKYALTLTALGFSDNEFVKETVENTIGKQGIMSLIFGLHLLNNDVQCENYTVDSVIEEVLKLELSDGGWAVIGNVSDIDVTAMTVQALSKHYETDNRVRTAVDKAVKMLSERQLEDGGYSSFGAENAESAAQVIVALTSLGINPKTDERFIKNGNSVVDGLNAYRLQDGSFCHTVSAGTNTGAVQQAFYSMISLKMLENNEGSFFVFDNKVKCDVSNGSFIGYKYICYILIAALMLLAFLILFLKKKNYKNFIFVFILAILASAFVFFTDFSSKADYYGAAPVKKENATGSVTVSIRCDKITGENAGKYVPKDGVILKKTEFEITKNDSVYDILVEAARANGIQIDSMGVKTGVNGMVYVSGINYIYELEYGEFSGWVYRVNGVMPSVGCNSYILSDGDEIEWIYTLDLGNDL